MITTGLRRITQPSRTFVRRKSSGSTAPMALPRLPVPNLRKTLDRYLKSIQPFLLEDEMLGGEDYASAYRRRVQLADEFEHGIGKVWQERLLELDRRSPHNWLEDTIWVNKAYLEGRQPLLINSNWWLTFVNDSMVPTEVLHGEVVKNRAGITLWQIRRAAWLVHRVLAWKDNTERHGASEDLTRTGVWLRDNTAKSFGTVRIPRRGRDMLTPALESPSASSRKLLVMLHDWCYEIDVHDASPSDIAIRLLDVVRDVERRIQQGDVAVPVGALSSDDRDTWADNLQHLMSLSPTNVSTFRSIRESSFCLCLDHITYTDSPNAAQLPEPDSQEELDDHLHVIRSGLDGRARNRWFDKPLSLVVEPTSRAGTMGEHAPVDALVPSIAMNYAVVQPLEPSILSDADFHSHHDNASGHWTRLDWEVDGRIMAECEASEERAKALVGDSEDSWLRFTSYGTDWIKSVARLAPDAYIQMALQLAWYRERGCLTATYETALTRMFTKARTETIRAVTVDSLAFLLAMNNTTAPTSEKFSCLRRAIQTHTMLSREAATGKGIDRHLLGLKLMANDGEKSALFDDELFSRSQEWKLSTSALGAGPQFRGTGFGAPYNDGYGINYLAESQIIKFGIESKISSSLTSTYRFKVAIQQALHDMQCINVNHSEVQSRL